MHLVKAVIVAYRVHELLLILKKFKTFLLYPKMYLTREILDFKIFTILRTKLLLLIENTLISLHRACQANY